MNNKMLLLKVHTVYDCGKTCRRNDCIYCHGVNFDLLGGCKFKIYKQNFHPPSKFKIYNMTILR